VTQWPNEVPLDLRRRLDEVLSLRGVGPAEVWGVVKEWLEAQRVEPQWPSRKSDEPIKS